VYVACFRQSMYVLLVVVACDLDISL